MALIEHTLEGVKNKVDIAIQRIRSFEPLSMGLFDTPYYVAYSGGKDSDVIRILCDLAGVKHDLVHNHTTADAPETIHYVRSIVKPENIDYPKTSMWKLIENRGVPTRIARFCCAELKERGGIGRFVITGVRWAESNNRKNSRGGVEVIGNKKAQLILNADNNESRRLLENCQLKGKRVLNPIIDWTDADVWDFLSYYGCKSNPLYQYGFNRVGCIGCPMASKGRIIEFQRWPKYKGNYIKAFQRLVNRRLEGENPTPWPSGQAVFDWWMNDKNLDRQIDGQEFIVGW